MRYALRRRDVRCPSLIGQNKTHDNDDQQF